MYSLETIFKQNTSHTLLHLNDFYRDFETNFKIMNSCIFVGSFIGMSKPTRIF